MTFSKSLFALMVLTVLAACSVNSEKPAADDNQSRMSEGSTNSLSEKTVTYSSVLPEGPATPNPYLQNTKKLSEQIEINFHDALASMRQKNWERAETLLTQLAGKDFKLSGVHLNLGIVYRNKGANEKAEVEFNRAIKTNPNNVYAYNQLAVLKRENGEFTQAENLYKKALVIWPFYPEAHKNIAILYDLYMGKPEQALPHYQAYQQLLSSPDKQVESWVADLQRRLNGSKVPAKMEGN